MSDHGELYALSEDAPEPDGPVLLYYLDGFMDAGSAGRLATEHLLATLEPRRVATFDVDRLIDYRSRRPPMTFDTDHWDDYQAPELAVHAMDDTVGTTFFLMTGPEPDHEWERFGAAVTSLVDRFGVRLSVGVHGIPMAVPHTRDVGVTPHGNRPDLLGNHHPWISRVQVPGSAGSLLEYRLRESGHDAIGFTAHVPHYLAQTEYPSAATALLEAVTAATGLAFPTAELHEAAEQAREQIDRQVTASSEVAEAVRGLEQQYDAITTSKGTLPLADDDAASMPTAEEIGAQFERFLAEQDGEAE